MSVYRHYEQIASSYDDLWTYSGAFVDEFGGAVVKALALKPADAFVDLGAGTGLYAKAIAARVGFTDGMLCVDPVRQLVSQAESPAIRVAVMDASDFSVSDVPATKILIKEAIHHIDAPERVLAALAAKLPAGGRILVAMLPSSIEYPLFKEALDDYAQRQPHFASVAAPLRAAGLDVVVDFPSFPVEIERNRYLSMVMARYMSLLSLYDDTRLAAGVQEIAAAHPEPVLRFVDRFVFVVGSKPA
jgi:ubiquinone/menaquinone biosynthesis C-methylase UbiE